MPTLAQKLRAIALAEGHLPEVPFEVVRNTNTRHYQPRKGSWLTIVADYTELTDGFPTRYVDCICVCGRKITRLHRTSVLKHGIISCGCKKKERQRSTQLMILEHRKHKGKLNPSGRQPNKKGDVNGYLKILGQILYEKSRYTDLFTAKGPLPGTSKGFGGEYGLEDGQYYWEVECGCGRIGYMTSDQFTEHRKKHCGSDVCQLLFAQKMPRSQVRKYVNRNFAGKVPRKRRT